jgi:hypothetical protein
VKNSQFNKENNMPDKFKEVPKGALNLITEKDAHCSFSVNEGEESTTDNFKMVGYSGKIIPQHWLWGNLAFDLDGFKFNKEKFPILWAHDDRDMDNLLGYSTTPKITDEGLVFTQDEVTFVDNERVTQFKEYSRKGVPFQASIRGNPTRIEYIEEGATTEVNGYEFVGPGHIWRETELIECSVCLFGADGNTSSLVFTEDKGEMVELDASIFISSPNKNENQNHNTEKTMDYLTFRKEHPEEAKKFTELVLEDAQNKFESEKKELIKEYDEKEKEFAEKVEELEAKVKEYEKEKLIFEENSRKEFAEKVWGEKLKEAEIPERLHEKVKAFVSAEKFVGEDGFDKDSFVAAVDKEIEFWAETKEEEKIQGSGSFSKKPVSENEFNDDAAEALANEMLGLIGHNK